MILKTLFLLLKNLPCMIIWILFLLPLLQYQRPWQMRQDIRICATVREQFQVPANQMFPCPCIIGNGRRNIRMDYRKHFERKTQKWPRCGENFFLVVRTFVREIKNQTQICGVRGGWRHREEMVFSDLRIYFDSLFWGSLRKAPTGVLKRWRFEKKSVSSLEWLFLFFCCKKWMILKKSKKCSI